VALTIGGTSLVRRRIRYMHMTTFFAKRESAWTELVSMDEAVPKSDRSIEDEAYLRYERVALDYMRRMRIKYQYAASRA
jgi:hypothetical protein